MSQNAANNVAQQGDSGPIPAAIAASPPIVDIIRFLSSASTASFGVISRTTLAVIFTLLAPISLLLTPISYLLSPVFVLVQVLLDVFVFAPYAVTAAIARNVYPIYVLVGVAVICALVVGFTARIITSSILHAIFAPRAKPKAAVKELQPERDAPPPPEPREKSAFRTGVPKTRVRKRVSIKEEREA
ncbi:hypothetical protein BD309DRAFT_568459 [Dichomitus squalens]|uniref:Uncharacterized protein n=2 Tax=Dichomitus squalens TaxID=114155 RepID=A0A4V6MWG3_9APHY|nr:hypothetical protein BD309DRAFT_568459 [Dichomitus squalens]TBU63036.1 hypothetical protein BD310DRAFT_917683 [Dichomitus squalens]